jgi:hypothetical protein
LALAGAGLFLAIALAVYAQIENARTRRMLEQTVHTQSGASQVTLSFGEHRVIGTIISPAGLVMTSDAIDLPVGQDIDVTISDGAKVVGRIVSKTEAAPDQSRVTLIQLPARDTPWPAIAPESSRSSGSK